MKKILHLGSGEELGRGIFLPLPGIFFLCLLDDEIGKINKVIMADVVADLLPVIGWIMSFDSISFSF